MKIPVQVWSEVKITWCPDGRIKLSPNVVPDKLKWPNGIPYIVEVI